MGKLKLDLSKKATSEEYHAELSKHSIAITQALHVMFKRADDLNLSELIVDDSLRLKIPAKEIYKGLDRQSQLELISAKNLEKKLNIINKLYTETLDTLLEEL